MMASGDDRWIVFAPNPGVVYRWPLAFNLDTTFKSVTQTTSHFLSYVANEYLYSHYRGVFGDVKLIRSS